MIKKIKAKWFYLSLLIIVILASFLRFYNYSARWGIAYDQAHDALVARYAVETLSIPLVAPFSSGAQFQDSGIWYWFLMIPTFLFNNFLLAPWIAVTLYCIAFVLVVALVGAKIMNKQFGLICGLFAAVSTSQIGQSVNLSLTALMSLVSLGAIYFAYLYLKDNRNIYIFLVGFFVSLALSIHLQAVLLLVFIPIFLFVAKVKDIRLYLLLLVGFLIPLTPLVIFDLKYRFVNSSGLLGYLLRGQEVSYEVLGRRWLTYLSVFWPSSWAIIIGGYSLVAYIIFAAILATLVRIHKKIEPIWIIIILTLIVDVVLMRYVKSPLFDSYLNFLHPFVLLTTAYAVYMVIKFKKVLGILLFLLIVGTSLYRDYGEITYASRWTESTVLKLQSIIYKNYPGRKFDFYDYKYDTADKSLPLVLFMDVDKKTDRNGIKIGIMAEAVATLSAEPKRVGAADGHTIFELASSSAKLQKLNWAPINPDAIYNSTENWYKDKL